MESAIESSHQNVKNKYLTAFNLALPIVLGYLPVGFAYGVLAVKTGISDFNAILMSILVYAGSAQFIAVGLLAAGGSWLSIVITTFIVNLRHLLMSAALSPHFKGWKWYELSFFAFELTDETFALHSTRFGNNQKEKHETFMCNVIAQSAWIGGSALGVFCSNLITDVRPMGLDYALPAMFIALLIFQLKDRSHLIVAGVSGLLSTAFLLGGAGQWNVILATLIGASLGVGLSWIKK